MLTHRHRHTHACIYTQAQTCMHAYIEKHACMHTQSYIHNTHNTHITLRERGAERKRMMGVRTGWRERKYVCQALGCVSHG